MSLWSDDRAAAIQVGAIVLFAFVIIAITAYQASVVPDQNEEIEYNHNQRVQSQLQELEGAIGSMPATQDDRTVTVDLSTSYPARTIFINPPTPTGRLQTLGTTNDSVAFEVQNATATNPDVADFWDGTTQNYSTGALTYTPNYHVYNQAPVTVVENSLVYNEFANKRLRSNAQSLFDGESISLVALRGSLREDGGTASVNVRPVSASTTTVPVKNSTSTDNVTISIVSRLSPREWNETLADAGELANQSGYVADVSGGVVGSLDGQKIYRVNFTMVRGQTYDLQLARVSVGQLSAGERTTNASYAVAVTETVTTEEDTNATVTVEVRDQYGNPKSNVEVNATVDGSTGTIADSPRTTNEDGRATFTYNTTDDISGSSSETDTVQVSFTGDPADGTFDETAPENVTATVTVKNTDGSGTGGGGGGGGGGAYNVTWQNPDGDSAVTCSEAPPRGECTIDVGGNAYATVTLTMETNPTVDGAGVSYAVSNQTVGTLNPNTGTVTGGTDSTTLNVTTNGTVYTYVSSGDDGDRINFTVTNVAAGGGGGGGTNSEPTADFTVTPSSPLVNESTEFDGTASSDSDGSIADYEWDFGDGSANSSAVTPTHPFDSAGTYTVTLTVTDDNGATNTTTKQVTVRALPKMTAVEPDPDALDDSDGEFVRVYFPTSTDTTGWTIRDDDGSAQVTDLPAESLSGEVYFARNPSAFASQWGIDPARVYNLDTQLANTGDPLELRTDTGRVIDEFAYKDPDESSGPTTSNGWNIDVDAGEVAVRKTDGSGNYLDTNESDDWLIEDENAFFGTDTSSPVVSSASVTNAPINYSDTNLNQTVTVNFNESMNTSFDPTVKITGLPNSNNLSVSGSWDDSTTWIGEVSFPQNDDDTTAVISVGGAEDDSGNVQNPDPDTSNTFEVDTDRPANPEATRITTAPIAASNQTSVSVEVDVENPDPDGGTVIVELTGPDGNTVTGKTGLNTGSGTVTTNVTGIDASALSDGTSGVTAKARVVDDAGNENSDGFTSQSDAVTKDTQAPVIEQFYVEDRSTSNGNNQNPEYYVEWEATDTTQRNVLVELYDQSGTRVDSNTTTGNGSTTLTGPSCGTNQDECSNYEIRISITDGVGQTTNDSKTDTVDGGGEVTSVTFAQLTQPANEETFETDSLSKTSIGMNSTRGMKDASSVSSTFSYELGVWNARQDTSVQQKPFQVERPQMLGTRPRIRNLRR